MTQSLRLRVPNDACYGMVGRIRELDWQLQLQAAICPEQGSSCQRSQLSLHMGWSHLCC